MDFLVGKIFVIIGIVKMNIVGIFVLENFIKIFIIEFINRIVKLFGIFFEKLNKFNKYLL